MIPEHLSFISKEAITNQLEKMNAIWDQRGSNINTYIPKLNRTKAINPQKITMAHWENALGSLAIGKDTFLAKSFLSNQLNEDEGLGIIKRLIEEFRKSLLIGSLKLSCRYLMLGQGLDEFGKILQRYWYNSKPLLFASDNGLQLARYLREESTSVKEDKILRDLVFYEKNVLETLIDNKEREI